MAKTGRNALTGHDQLAYIGSADADASAPILWLDRAPTVNDYDNFPLGTLWIDTSPVAPADPEVYVLCRKKEKTSTWVRFNEPTIGGVKTLTGDNAVVVPPDALNNVNILSGVTGLSLDGNAGTYTLTFNNLGGGPFLETITGDVGGAIEPAGVDGNININGGANISITGSGSTFTIDFVGPLPVSEGGTGVLTLTDHALLVGSGAGSITSLAAASDGEIPIGSSGSDPITSTITAGANITITNGPGSITIDSTGNPPSVRTAWTPGLSFSGGSVGMVLAIQEGWYIGFDDIIFYYGHIKVTTKGSSVGLVRIENLPFPAVAAVGTLPGRVIVKYVAFPSLPFGPKTLYPYTSPGNNYLYVTGTSNQNPTAPLLDTAINSFNDPFGVPYPSEFWFSGFYFRA